MKGLRGKHWRRRADGAAKSSLEMEAEVEVDERPEPVIVRRKSFVLTPMDELEAMEQLMLLGHEDFFLFSIMPIPTKSMSYIVVGMERTV